jgi:hypothetical protein
MQDYDEKRNYPRMEIECPASFEVVGAGTGGAIVKNLSGGGVLMWLDQQLKPGAAVRIEIRPVNEITPPMQAELEVLRCTPLPESDGSFAVACEIRRILG